MLMFFWLFLVVFVVDVVLHILEHFQFHLMEIYEQTSYFVFFFKNIAKTISGR